MIHRIHKNSNYTVISNVHLRDNNLSLKTKGLLSIMLSLPDDWNYSRNGLVAIVKEGKAVVDACLKELEDNGYLVRSQTRGCGGKMAESVYDIYETPQPRKPLSEKPTTEKPTTENQTQVNTIYTNNYINQIKKDKPSVSPTDFDIFWKAYPKKQSKKDAEKAWKKVSVPLSTLLTALENQKQSRQWTENNGQYIPNAATWLNGERWNDVLDPQKNALDDTKKYLNHLLERNE